MGWKLVVGSVLGGGLIAYLSGIFSRPPDPPEVGNGWWGRGDKPEEEEEDTSVRPFKIHFSDEDLADLKDRLRKTRWFESIEGTKFHYGIRPEYMKTVVDYWQNKYDWRLKEEELNQYQNYKTKIEGIDIHFVRATPRLKPGQTAKPIMMVHGWPSSFYEYYKIIPMLTDPVSYGGNEEDVFEVVVPSLPGYGFSEAPHRQGLNVRDVGRIFHKLMSRLGFDSYYVQGGDWGAMVVDQMAGMFPSHIRGMHANLVTVTPSLTQMVTGKLFPSFALRDLGYAKYLPGWDRLTFALLELGYMHLQATKPDTVGHALTDSPVGLAAYIIEKFSSWTNYDWIDLDDGGLDAYWPKDDLLTNVMIYWVSGCITPSMRLYKETLPKYGHLKNFLNNVPVGLADLPHDLARAQENWAARHFTDIVSFKTYPTGGHFGAFEVPELLAEDIRQFVQKVEQRLAKKSS